MCGPEEGDGCRKAATSGARTGVGEVGERNVGATRGVERLGNLACDVLGG